MMTPEEFARYTFWHRKNKPSPLIETKMSDELGRAMEDYIVTIIDSWDEVRQATAYWYLNRSGMTLARARAIRVKAGLSD